jgi:nucleoporin NDC1
VEDQFGVVQRDIPQILEALSSFLHAVDQYHVEVKIKHTPPTLSDSSTPSPQDVLDRECVRVELEKAQETLLDVRDVLKDAVAHIVRTFGGKLVAFKFPVQTAERLQPFLDSS